MPEINDHFNQSMLDAVLETLETLAFMEVVGVTDPPPEALETTRFYVVLSVEDPKQGELELRMTSALVRQIAENLYVVPQDELGEQLVEDTAAEIINIIAGRFMTALLPPEQPYQLGLPEVSDTPPETAGAPAREWLFRSGGEHFLIRAAGQGLLSLA